MTVATEAVNVIPTRAGRARIVCRFCGRLSRSLPTPGLADLPQGWAMTPWPADHRHPDGTTGDQFTCATCCARTDFPISPREYLRGDKKNGPDSAASEIEANDTPQGENMSTTTVHPDTDIHPDIAVIFREIDDLNAEQFLILDPDEPFATGESEEWTRPLSDFGDKTIEDLRRDVETGRTHHWVLYYRPDGTLIPKSERDDAWYDTEHAGINRRSLNATLITRNAALRTASGYLLVSAGCWHPNGETTVDGQPAFTFINPTALAAQAKHARAAYLDAHPEIAKAQPSWADSSHVTEILDDGAAEVEFRVDRGAFTVAVSGEYRNGELELDEPQVYAGEFWWDLDAEKLRRLAADANELADRISALK